MGRGVIATYITVLICGSASAYFVTSAASMYASTTITGANNGLADAKMTYRLLEQRLNQEAQRREYANRVSSHYLKTGHSNFGAEPTLRVWPHTDPAKNDVIINKQHPIYPLLFEPKPVVVSCGPSSVEVSSRIKTRLIELCLAAASDGAPLILTSGYRSYDDQALTYLWWQNNRGDAAAEASSAHPGYSEHQSGLAVDFATASGIGLEDFMATKQYQWLQDNAWHYGFVQRYTLENSYITGYEAESWHYRYIGTADAERYHQGSYLSLEQFWRVTGGDYTNAVSYTTKPADAK